MNTSKQFEILNGLPGTGPMYFRIPDIENTVYSEGFVVRFFKSDGTNWVANFQSGWTNFNKVCDFPENETVIVIAGGNGYVMSPEENIPKFSFGLTIEQTLQTEDGSLICSDGLTILFFDNSNGEFWQSERISWDGIKDLLYSNGMLHGKSYDPLNSTENWTDFSIDLKTKKISGGSFQDFLQQNPNLQVGENGLLKEKSTMKKPWWKFW